MEQQVKIYQQFLMKYIKNFVNIKFLNNFWIESLLWLLIGNEVMSFFKQHFQNQEVSKWPEGVTIKTKILLNGKSY